MGIILALDSKSMRYEFDDVFEGVTVGFRVYWIPRCAGWYLDLLTPAGEDVATGIRITPQAPLAVPGSWDGAPPGRFVVTGPARYGREDLGTQVQVWYLTADEVAEAG